MTWAIAYVIVGLFFAEAFLAWSRHERENTRGTEAFGYFVVIVLWPTTLFFLIRGHLRRSQ